MNIHNRTIVIDAVFSQDDKPFDCVSIMNYIRENEIAGRTLDHHDIAEYLDRMHQRGYLQTIASNCDFTKYVVK